MTRKELLELNDNIKWLHDLNADWDVLNTMWDALYRRDDHMDDENIRIRQALNAGCICISTVQRLLERSANNE